MHTDAHTRYQLLQPATHEVAIKKSRFLATAAKVTSEAAAHAFIAKVSAADATHNCWAYRMGDIYRFNDDGEPGGSAGKPILAAIDGEAMDQTAVVVTRWFGGIKLGVGGLIRAYGGSAQSCLQQAQRAPIIAHSTFRLVCGYSDLELIKARLQELDARFSDETYAAAHVALTVNLPQAHLDQAHALIQDISRGQAQISAV